MPIGRDSCELREFLYSYFMTDEGGRNVSRVETYVGLTVVDGFEGDPATIRAMIKAEHDTARLGMKIGGGCMAGGVVLAALFAILGRSESASFAIKGATWAATLTNASPGVFLFFVGLGVFFFTRARFKASNVKLRNLDKARAEEKEMLAPMMQLQEEAKQVGKNRR